MAQMPQIPQIPASAISAKQGGRFALLAGVAVLGLMFFGGSYFVVPQTDVAFVKRFGKVVSPQTGPLQPGLHFKIPFIDESDRIRITTDTFELPEKKAFTKDTQEITLRVGVTYRVPTTAAYHLLYEIGKAGNEIGRAHV